MTVRTLAAVATAVAAAQEGDTVVVPGGNCSWGNTLNLTQGVTLQGAGPQTTTIAPLGVQTLINVNLAHAASLRIHDLGFVLGPESLGSPHSTAVEVSGAAPGTSMRLDHLHMVHGTYAILFWVDGYGVIDHNTFVNSQSPIFLRGSDNGNWDRPMEAGTANAMFVEDNRFEINNDTVSDTFDAQVYIQEGASVVVRYNTFDTTGLTKNMNYINLNLNNHGNQNYYTGQGDFRGQPLFEFYNNVSHSNVMWDFAGLRGGSALLHHNVFTAQGSATVFKLEEEEGWQIAFFDPLRTIWPAQDQINNTFLWENTFNGTAVTQISLGESGDAPFIQEGRDYFMHAPQATGGQERYTGRLGGDMVFTPQGPNKYYPYVPYHYPHPLTLAPGLLAAPRNLRTL